VQPRITGHFCEDGAGFIDDPIVSWGSEEAAVGFGADDAGQASHAFADKRVGESAQGTNPRRAVWTPFLRQSGIRDTSD